MAKKQSAFEKKDAAKDKKQGIKENSKKDKKIDSAAMRAGSVRAGMKKKK